MAEYTLDNQPNPTPNVSYLTEDTLGSPRIITGKNGEVISRRDFMPFGEEIAVNETNRKSALGYNYASTTRQSFTGYEKDTESGLEFAQNRYYSSKLGRFTTVDPMMASADVQDAQSWNRYAYVRNNPLNLVDPAGLYYGTKEGDPNVQYFSSLEEMAAKGYTELKDYVYMVGDQFQLFRRGKEEGAVMVATNAEAIRRLVEWGSSTGAAQTLVEAAAAVAAGAAAAKVITEENPALLMSGCGRPGAGCVAPLTKEQLLAMNSETDAELVKMVPPVVSDVAAPAPQNPNERPPQDPNKPKFQTGQDLERTVHSKKHGEVGFIAEVLVNGKRITLKDIVIYGKNGDIPSGEMTREVIRATKQLFKELKDAGFREVRIVAERVPNTSSSANPGKNIDLIYTLR